MIVFIRKKQTHDYVMARVANMVPHARLDVKRLVFYPIPYAHEI